MTKAQQVTQNRCGQVCPHCHHSFDELSELGFDNHRENCFLAHLPDRPTAGKQKISAIDHAYQSLRKSWCKTGTESNPVVEEAL